MHRAAGGLTLAIIRARCRTLSVSSHRCVMPFCRRITADPLARLPLASRYGAFGLA